MSGRIPQQFIDELLARADIVEIIDARVPLKKRGREYVACCPFHGEKTPSFYVSPQKQFYHCFGCGAHGTAIGFLMEYEHMDFPESVETIARSLGLEVPHEGGDHRPREGHDDLYALMEAAQRYFRDSLRQAPAAIEYLKGRGLTGETASEFGLGYAPDRWDGLLQALGSTAQGAALARAGLVIEKGTAQYYDRFRGRIMFPIRDRRGRIIAFGGRVIGPGEPKYLNSPETPIFHKGHELYGLFEARRSDTRLKRLYVVEGYMDVIALAQAGVRNAVATLGTATTRDHLERIFRVVPEVVFCFDGDRAGRQAAWRALEVSMPIVRDGREVYFLFLPEGEDPDSLVRQKGAQGFDEVAAQAVGITDFLLRGLKERHAVASREGRASLAEEAKGLLKDLAPGILREQVLSALAKVLDLSIERLERHFESPPAEPLPTRAPEATASQQIRVTPVRLAVALLLQRPGLAAELSEIQWLQQLDLPGAPLLWELLEMFRSNPHLTTAGLLERWRGRSEESHLLRLLEWQLPETQDEVLDRMFHDAIDRLRLKHRHQRTDYLLNKSQHATLGPEEKSELQALLAAK